ncbi:MAG TPA: hypothetical protein VJH70_02800 [Candidatus Paceibacterota bacterium]
MDKKYYKFIAIGFVCGLILFFTPTLLQIDLLLGSGALIDLLPKSVFSLFLVGVPYSIGGGILFFLIRTMFKKQNLKESLYFTLGMYIPYVLYIILALIALSNWRLF